MTSAVVVGSGPNGLAAAVVLARAGLDVTVFEAAPTIGGGTRSAELTLPGVIHDECSAFHPMAAAGPFFTRLDLPPGEIVWRQPEIDCAHPLDDGTSGLMYRSLEQTAAALGADGERWRRLFGASAAHFADLLSDTTQPLLRIPRHPITLSRFGIGALMPASAVNKLWSTEPARALWSGVAAHAFTRLDRPLSSAVGLMLIVSAHAQGWVVAEGGSQAIANALAADVVRHGGRIETNASITSLDQLPPYDVLMLDADPAAAAALLGDRLPSRVAWAYRRYRHGPGAFKVDFAIEGDVPWTAEPVGRAGTAHLGGSSAEVMATERDVEAGRMPERPFVLVGQQYLADPTRSSGGINPIWTYAHVPNGYTGDATDAIIGQIERFAPGFRERIVATAVRSTTELARTNPNYVGGDIIGGLSSPFQVLFRPRLAVDPYFTGVPGTYLCSASTPPGAGAHGVCGANAAARAIGRLGRPNPLAAARK